MKLVRLQGGEGPFYINPEMVISVGSAATPSHVLARQRELGIPPVDNGCVYVVTPNETYLAVGDMYSVYKELRA
jgi:hypothetical protein